MSGVSYPLATHLGRQADDLLEMLLLRGYLYAVDDELRITE